jgi:CheY-like chemotaxis protein
MKEEFYEPLRETAGAYLVRAHLPAADVNVGVEHRVLTMMGEGKFEKADVDLLDVNGYELAPVLRERARTGMLRLIALTRSREHEDRELARTAGFERYLLKPVATLDLSNLLEMPGSPAR